MTQTTLACIDGQYGAWSEWSNCSAYCGLGIQTRTRLCNNPPPSDCGRYCIGQDTEIKNCHSKECEEGIIDWCSDEEDRCGQVAHGGICSLLEDDYLCSCQPGWKIHHNNNGTFEHCHDIEECELGSHDCDPVAICTNTLGGYTCECPAGYDGNGTHCEDVDECATSNATNCDDHAYCQNLAGGYTCVCEFGFKSSVDEGTGFVGQCIEDRFYPFGVDQEDFRLTASSARNRQSLTRSGHHLVMEEASSTLIGVENGIPLFGGIICNSVYVSENGLLVITSTKAEEQEYINEYLAFRHPESMDSVLESNRTNVCGVLAAFWSNNRFNGLRTNQGPRVWYQAYTNTSGNILQRSNQDVARYFPGTSDYRATFTLVATWEDMVPDWETADGETNTFQAVLTTDNVNTYVWYLYKDQGMTWVPNYLPDVIQFAGYPARVGYAVRNSYTSEEDHNSAQWAWVSSEENVYRIDQKVSMTTNMTGRIAYRLENNGPDFVNPVKACRDWYNEEPDPDSWAREVMDTCPGYLSQAREEIGLWEAISSSEKGHVCFQRRFALSTGGNLDCCYKKEDQGLITSLHMWNKGTGFVHKYEKSTNETSEYYLRDYLPRMWCCRRSRSDKCCELYAEKRPTASHRKYTASFLATAYGEPHIRTLDGRTYTFNGHGEYVMLRSTADAPHTFMMQGRTDRPVMDGVRIRATVFTAIAVQQPNNKVQVYLDSNGTGVRVTIDDESIPLAAIADGSRTKFNDGLITVIHDAGKTSICGVVISYPSGISASIKAQAGLLTFVLGLGADMRSNLQGLLGNLNGDPNDDFILPNGSYVHATTPDEPTEKELYYNFGKMWSTRSVCLCDHTDVNNVTLFHNYPTDPSHNSPENYGDDNFVPKFFDDDDLFPNEETRKMAMAACGADNRECIYDIALTSQVDIGLTTTQSETEYRTSNEILRNNAPEVFAPTEIRAVVNKTYTTKVRGMDACPYVNIAVTGAGTLIKSGNYSADFTWTPTSEQFVAIEFTVSDDMGASTITVPDVTVCACQNGGTCDFDGVTDRVEGFALAVCICPTGFIGTTCQTDVDACEGNPCFQGVECTDQPAPLAPGQPGYICGACPFDMVGNGETCADLNECLLDLSDRRVHQCVNADCENTPGSYSCVCHDGFAKEGDSRICTDIDECRSLNTNDCDPLHGICNNTVGSYTCSCQAGCYTNDNGRTCLDINECMTQNGGCERLCTNTKGSYSCECGVAYVLAEDGHTCEELDECAAEHVCEQICVDKVGYYDCECDELFTLNLDGRTCDPIINCSTNNPCTPPPIGHCAMNLTDSGDLEEQCVCAAGYKILPNNTCADINECDNGHKCDEHGDCVNTEGSYECSCHLGYKLDKDHGKRHCRNIDECAIDNGNCTHMCVDTLGSFYCTCPLGMVLDKDMCTCVDIDECAENLAECSVNARCNNTSPGYDCICDAGYTGDGIKCGDINECLYQDVHDVRCKVGCQNTLGSFVCICSIGWQRDNDSISCTDMDECLLGKDGCDHNCQNAPGSYTCSCREGYLLRPDGHTCRPNLSSVRTTAQPVTLPPLPPRPSEHPSTTTTQTTKTSRPETVTLPPRTVSSEKPSTTTTQTTKTSRPETVTLPPRTVSSEKPSTTTTQTTKTSRPETVTLPPRTVSSEKPSTTTTQTTQTSRRETVTLPPRTVSSEKPGKTTTQAIQTSRQETVTLPPRTVSSEKPSTTTTQTTKASQRETVTLPQRTVSSEKPSIKTTTQTSERTETSSATLMAACRGGCGAGGRCEIVNGSSTCVCDPGFQLTNGTCVGAVIPVKTKVLLPAVALSIGIPLLCLVCACLAAYRRRRKQVKYYTIDGGSTNSGGRWIWLPKREGSSSSGYFTWTQNTPNSGSIDSIYNSNGFPWTYSTPNQSSKNSDMNSNSFPWTYSTPNQSANNSDMNSNDFPWTYSKPKPKDFPWTFWKTNTDSGNSDSKSNDFPWTYSKPNQSSNSSSDGKSNDSPWTYSKPNNSSDNSDRNSNDSPRTFSKPNCNSTSSDSQELELPGLNRYLPYPNSYRSLRSLSSGSMSRRSLSSRLTGTLSNMSSMTSLGSSYRRNNSPSSPRANPSRFCIQRPRFIDPSAFKEKNDDPPQSEELKDDKDDDDDDHEEEETKQACFNLL
ncbi:FBN3 [Branchiostoma lanceolatum]|uniref:FBN3 protein n=1 Tax=Branchiostoma lanceolatum TaxID=7740 RepID=A0A8J9YMQ8_BRALA|nr:FBN3 [Branchiostoma lanceolatum]